MTKAEIRDHVLHGRELYGSAVAQVSKDMRSIRLRHVWRTCAGARGLAKEDDRVLEIVRRTAAEYAREIADATGDLVEIYSKQGNLLDRVVSQHKPGTRGATCTSRESFVPSLPPPYAPQGRIYVSETVRRDLKLAMLAGLLPPDAKFWVREISCSPVISVEFAAWTGAGAVLAEYYAAAVMDALLAKRDTQWGHYPKMPPQDARLSPAVNEAIALIARIGDRRIAEVMATKPENYYGPIQYRLDIRFSRLIAAAERGLRLEVEPEYADFMRRALIAADRLGRRAVRGICGEGGVDLGTAQELDVLVALDTEARGRPVHYSSRDGRWVVGEDPYAR